MQLIFLFLLIVLTPTFADEIPEKEQAEIFDKLINNKLPPSQVSELKSSCKQSENYSVFCYSILNREALDTKLRLIKNSRPTSKIKTKPTQVSFKHGKIANWMEVRFANVQSLLKGLFRLKLPEIQQVHAEALKESNCPNNAAIATAATLEEHLPDSAKLEDLAELYDRGSSCALDSQEEQSVMLTRAGIFYFAAKKYDKAEEALRRACKLKDSYKGRALYWLYRSQLQLDKKKEASKSLEELQTTYPFSFHTLVALTSINEDPGEILLNDKVSKLTRSTRIPHLNSLIIQVENLNKYGYENTSEKVLDWALMESPGVEPEVMLYLATLKEERGSYQSTLSILSDVLYRNPDLISKQTMEKYFPKVYFSVFEKNSNGMDPFLLLAIARRESAFNKHALSSANARGLMQVVQQRRGRHKSRVDLFDPENNIKAGSKYFSELLNRVNGQVHLALLAYNAGPLRINQWTSRYPNLEPVLFIDLIPYRETRDYVAAVLRNYYWYRRIHHVDKRTPASIMRLSSGR